MKINAWLRFGLIVLCLAMAMSMFACGNTGDETTEAPKTETTEAPTSAPTEAPTQAPTEAPTQAPTEEPTQAPTEAPTQAPTEEPTQAPTEAPTEEPTEEPTEPAEDNKDEAIANIDMFFGKTELELVTPNDGLYAEPTDDGVLYINDFNMDGNFTLFQKRAAEDGPTGQYFFIKYKASAKTYIQLFTAVDSAVPTGNRCYTLNNTNYLVNDEEWHIAIVDMAAFAKSGIYAGTDGKFYVQHLRLDIEGGEGIWAEIAYVGYESDLADIIALAQAYDNEAALQTMCACSALTATATFTDKDTHAATCSLCGKTSAVAHSGAAAGVWNGKYYESNSACTVCGEKYNFGANLFAEAESLNSFAQNAWNTAPLTGIDENGVTYAGLYSKNAAGGWSNGYFFINPTGAATGQYVVFRYKLSGGEGDRDFELMIDTAGGFAGSVKQTLVNDGEWHIAVYDFTNAASCAPDANGNYVLSNNGRPNLSPWNANEGIMFDWIATYDNIERMPLEYRYILNPDYVEPEVEETTEAPTEEPTEVETEAPVEIVEPNKYYAGNDFGSMTTVVLEKEATADGYKFTNAVNNDAYVVFYEKNTDVTGQYLFFKYRANDAGWTVWASTTNASAVWGDHYGWAPIGDGEWHLAVIDLSKTNPVKTNEDGKYAVKYIRIDIEGSAGVWAEFAYAGVAEDLAGLGAYLRATDAKVKDICPCPAGSQNPNLDGTTTCEVCGKKGIYEIDYTGPTYQYTIDAIGSAGSVGGRNAQTQYNRGDVCADPLSSTLTFGGWVITERGMSKYMYRLIVDGEAQAWTDWADWDPAKISPPDIQGVVAEHYKSWNPETAAYGSRFYITVTFDLVALHGKKVDIEFVAVTRSGAILPVFTAYNVTPEHSGIGGFKDNEDGTHDVKCAGCDVYWLKNDAHSFPNHATWDETDSVYYAYCIYCGGKTEREYQWIVDYSKFPSGHKFATGYVDNSKAIQHSIKNGTLDMSPARATAWGGMSIGEVDNNAKLGRYYIVKYKVTKCDSDTASYRVRFNKIETIVNMVFDNQWHYAIIDLAATVGGIDENNQFTCTGDHWVMPYGDTNLRKFNIAFEACVDSLDRLPESFECCHPEIALEVIEYAGVEGHTVKCGICGEQQTAAHTPSNTIGVKVEGGYAKKCTVCGGATAEAAVGNIFYKGSELPAGYNLVREDTDAGVKYTQPTNTDANFTIFSSQTGVESGQYLFIKYRGNAKDTNFFVATDYAGATGSRNTALYPITNAGWKIAIIDLSARMTFPAGSDGKYYVQHLRVDVEGGGNNCWMEIAYIGFANDLNAIIASINAYEGVENTSTLPVETCGHTMPGTTTLAEYVPVGGGSGLEYYANCLTCGAADKAVRPISVGRLNFDNGISADETAVCNIGVAGGWMIITGGVQEFQWVLTNKNDSSERAVVVVPVTGVNGGVAAAEGYDAFGPDRGYSGGLYLSVADWANVDGVDFIGDTVTVQLYYVSKADPDAGAIYYGKWTIKPAHATAYNEWDEANKQYVGTCACGVSTGEIYDARVTVEAEDKTIGVGGYQSSERVMEANGASGKWVQSTSAAGSWSQTYFALNTAEVVTGQYLVIRYMAPQAVTGGNLIISINNSNHIYVPLTISEEWQIVIVDLSAAGYDANSVFSNASRLTLNDWAAGEGINFDWFKLYETYDRIPDAYKPQ